MRVKRLKASGIITGETGHGHGLQQDLPGSGEGGDEEALAAEDGGPDAPNGANVVVEASLPSHRVPCGHLEHLPGGQGELDDVSGRVDPGGTSP